MTETSVYQYFDSRGRLLYVGVTGRGQRRQAEHARSKTWWSEVAASSVEHYPTRDEALAREQALIQTYRPTHNVVHNGGPAPVVSFPTKMLAATMERQRRRDYYALSNDEKHLAPCVVCGRVTGPKRGPTCDGCMERRNRPTS